jgi:colanic acid/amylovoran biosynthesis protein
MTSRIVVFNVFGHRNTGDAMLLEALVDLLLRHRPASAIEGIAFDVASERRWMPEIRWHERISNKTRPGPLGQARQIATLGVGVLIAMSRLFLPLRHLMPAEQRNAVEALDGADLAISCPGGYLEDSNKAYLANLLQMLIARRLARKVVLAPQSLGPIRSERGRKAMAFTLKRMDAVYAREKPSLAFAGGLTSPGEIVLRESGDLAFWYDRHREDGAAAEWAKLGVDPARPIVGMTVVEWYFPHHPDPTAAQQAYLDSLSALIAKLRTEGRHQIVLFNQVASDLPVAERLAAMSPGLIVDREARDSGVFAAMIARCELFVGSRFHSCIFGLLGAVPTIAIAYLPKTSGIMADLGLADYVIAIDAITPDTLITRFDAVRANAADVSAQLHRSIADYRGSNGRFVTDLENWTGEPAELSGRAPVVAQV